MRWNRSYRPRCLPSFTRVPCISHTTRLLLAGAWVIFGLCQVTGATQVPTASVARPGLSLTPRPQSEVGCAACHQMDPLFSHPVNVMPTMKVPQDLPLQGGRLTCTTCHDPMAHSRAGQTHDPLLRQAASATTLCARCHTARDASAKSYHAASLNRAHLRTPSRQASLTASTLGVDSETSSCLACHDGMMATGVTMGSDPGPRDHASNHPVGILYKTVGRPRGAPVLNAATTLDSRIRLFDQRIGCGSCHSLYSKEEGLLVMSNFHSRLCLSCHRE